MEVPNTMWGFRSSSTLANIFLLLLVAMIFSVSHISASKQFQNETDRLALLEFKKQIYNDPLGVLNSWNHSQHHCQWEGITCGTRHQRVIALTLRHKHFSGIISPLVGNLSFMRFIHLEENQFHGEIPQEFGRLFRLRVLNLPIFNSSAVVVISVAGNSFHGNLPTNIGLTLPVSQPWGKQILCLKGGNILDNVLMNCQNLQYLDISQNNFTGIISPHFLETHSSLIYVGLSENSFTGSLPPEVGKLIHLADFNVSHNQLVGDIPMSLADCSNLENLFMQANFFQGTIPPNLASLKSIQQLDLSSNNLTVPIPSDQGEKH
nr:LRR receptor-like serine/threonine-protein kinase EFR [Coffea arabica]